MSDGALRPEMAAQPVLARVPLLDRKVPAQEAFSVILFECLAHAAANIPAVLEGDSEGLHQLRVGLRRLRTALTSFGDARPEFAALNARAKAITTAVGPARDFDVFLTDLFDPVVGELGPHRGFEIMRGRILRARDKAWAQTIREMARPDFAQFQDDVAAAAALWTGDSARKIGRVAPQVLNAHYKRAQKRGRHLSSASPTERHGLRIALKKLRYTAEFFVPLYPKKAVRGFLGPLKDLQDLLGHLNDVAQVRTQIGRLMMEEANGAALQADLSHAAGLLQGYHQAHTQPVLHKTAKRWKAFKKAEVFWG